MEDARKPRLIVLSAGVRRIPSLDALVPDFLIQRGRPVRVRETDRVLAWGLRPSALRARHYAERRGLSVCHVEDGFLRSVKPGQGEPPLSVVLDDQGLYLDASRPSRLESLIAAPANWSSAHEARAEALMAAWRAGRVSKYNHARDWSPPDDSDFVLVADQTYGDASISCGAADTGSFTRALRAALDEHPDCTVVVKVHPDVVAGRKKGHFDLASLCRMPRVRVVANDAHPAGMLARARAVYTVTSQLGFEALIWGRPVRTFGMPFYAGWGLTQDDAAPTGRRVPVPLPRLVHAALIDYSRYVHPETGQACQVEAVIAWLSLQRRMRGRYPSQLCAAGFSGWKKPFVREFFRGSHVAFVKEPRQVPADAVAVAVWGRKHDDALTTSAPVIRLEDGFLRSVGLGASLIRPLSWVQDEIGIYYDAMRPSQLERLLATAEFPEELLQRAAGLRTQLCLAGITKYNLAGGAIWRRPENGRRVVLVPGQVETDASIQYGASGIRGNVALLQAVRQACPDAWVLYKPHPDVVARLRKAGENEADAGRWCDEIIGDMPLPDLLAQVEEVHVLTSLMGFEALLRGVPVVTYGQPFYAGWGLTRDNGLQDRVKARRTRRLSLDELVAATLLLYPTYVSRVTGQYTTPERALQELLEWRAERRNRTHALCMKWIAWLFRKP